MPKILNPTEPLGLPRGSVRAILALTLIFTFAQQVITQNPISDPLLVLASVVATFYFKTRSDETADNPQPEPLADPVVG